MSKRSKGKVKVAPVQTKVEIKLSPLQELLKSLFVVSEARLVSKEKRLSAEAVSKVIASLENVVTTIIKESRKEEWQKYAIRLVMAIQLSSGLPSALSKKIVSIFFTFLLSELKRNWRDYGFKEEDVHEDYVRF